jgi:glycerol kinase
VDDLAIALDLGTTRVKAARLRTDGSLGEPVAVEAPAPAGEGLVRESDPLAYLAAAERALGAAAEGTGGKLPVGLASQRSSFLLWDRKTAEPLGPLVSWQDRRSTAWCREHADLEPLVSEATGLPLSPHYFATKLAVLLEQDGALRARAEAGEVIAGTLDAWLTRRWTGEPAGTDVTMAARTLLLELAGEDWSERLLARFGIPGCMLPVVGRSRFAPREIPGRGRLVASLSDQASGLLAAAGTQENVAVVNLGTGCFVLVPTGEEVRRAPGYLTGPVLAPAAGAIRWALEGTVNAGGAVVDRFHPGPTGLPADDPAPDAWCLPDAAGVGAPWWRPDLPFTISRGAAELRPADLRRVALEGLLFRIRGILEDLPGADSREVLLSGGLVHEPFVPAGLAACLGRPVTVLQDLEGTLRGAALLAAEDGASAGAHVAPGADGAGGGRPVPPGPGGAYLPAKYERWRAWMVEVVGA